MSTLCSLLLDRRLPSESVTLTDAIGYYSTLNFSEDAVEEMGNIYGYVLVRRELGVKKSDLQTWFTEHRRNPVLSLVRHLELMTECYLIVKVGVVHVRYVAQAHVKPWLIDSEKIPKPRNNNQLGGGGVLDFAVNSQCFRQV